MADDAIPPAVLAQHVAVLGKTGSGKTSTAKLAVEQLVADGGRVCVLDPIKSDWWGLTSSADGKHPGLEFSILGGPRGHVALHSTAGKVIGELVADGTLPLSIIDMAEFEPGGLQKFFAAFADALLRNMRGVVHLVVEEAHEFAPKERAGIGGENLAVFWAKKLATAGRSKGVRLILATQRTQALHNALLGSCETMIVHRLTAPADQEPVKSWLKANTSKDHERAVAESLSSLKTGTGWICSAEAGIFEQKIFPRIWTFDNSATPTKDSGRREVKTATVDRERLRSVIGEAVADAEANDPARLRAEIARLKAETETARPAPVNLDSAKRVAELLEVINGLHTHLDRAQKAEALWEEKVGVLRGRLASMADSLDHMPDSIREQVGELVLAPAASLSTATSERLPKPPVLAARPAPSPVPASGVSVPQGRVLSALAFWQSVGESSPSREQVAAVAGYSPGSGNFSNLLGGLRTAGYVEFPVPGDVSLSVAGAALVSALTPQEACDRLLGVLGAPQIKLVDAALTHGSAVSREQLAHLSGYSAGSGNFSNLVGSLCTLDVFERRGPGVVALSDWAKKVLRGGKR